MSLTRLERLQALRDAQQAVMDAGVPAREFAALSREYRATLGEIAELKPEKAAVDGIDEIAQRRTARRSGTAADSRSAGR